MRYNISKIRDKTAYSPQEIANLLEVNRKTVFRWVREGLELLDPNKKPRLVMGKALKDFIIAKREAKQVRLNWNEFYCLKCQKAVIAKRASESIEKTGKTIGRHNREQEIIYAKCKECGSAIARFT